MSKQKEPQESMKKKLCDNAISREEALLMLTGENLPNDALQLISIFSKRIQNLPAVQPVETTKLENLIDETVARIRSKYGWISVDEKLPAPEQEVLITAVRKFPDGFTKYITTTAMYEDGTISECDSTWGWIDIDYDEWDEENDCAIIPKGWWELRHYNPDGVYNNEINDTVIAWLPLSSIKYTGEQDAKDHT